VELFTLTFLRLFRVDIMGVQKDSHRFGILFEIIPSQMLVSRKENYMYQNPYKPAGSRVGYTEWARVENWQPVPVPASTRGLNPVPVSNPKPQAVPIVQGILHS
jgi:hypothetical protein